MGKKIYIVDDDPDMVKVISFRLKSFGFEISSFTSGKEALEKMLASPPDLALLDMQIPDVTGNEIEETLSKNSATQNVPVIFLTGKTNFDPSSIEGNPNRALFIKPCDFDDLVEKIHQMLESH